MTLNPFEKNFALASNLMQFHATNTSTILSCIAWDIGYHPILETVIHYEGFMRSRMCFAHSR